MLQEIRRIVTGHNQNGRSIIVNDEPSPHTVAFSDIPACGMTNLWVTNSILQGNEDMEDPAARGITLLPPKGGSVFRVVEFPPDRQIIGKFDRQAVFAAMSAEDALDRNSSRHPLMHKTATIDYAVVISGEIYAVMEEEETLLRAGDCLIQRGTNHAWSNRSDQPCLVAFVLIDASAKDR